MSPTPETSRQTPPSVFERWQSLTVGLYMSIVGYSVLAGIPVISTAWSTLLGSAKRKSDVAGADLGGLSCGAVIAALLVSRFDRRIITLCAILSLCCSIGLYAFDAYSETLILRFLAGVASGCTDGVAVATLGGRRYAARFVNHCCFPSRLCRRASCICAAPEYGFHLLPLPLPIFPSC